METLETRRLLSVNLYDPGAAAGNTTVQDAISTQIVEVFDQLGDLGDGINADVGLNDTLNSTSVPLLDQTLRDITGEQVGDFYNFAAGSTEISTYLAGTNPTSAGLQLQIQGLIDSNPRFSGTVTDNSTGGMLDIRIDLSESLSAGTAIDIELHEAAEEFNLDLADDAEVNLKKSRSLSYSIEADLSNFAMLGDEKFWVDLSSAAEFHAEATHTATTDPLNGFGMQVGILGMRDAVGDAGAWVFEGEYLLDISAFLNFDAGAGSGAGSTTHFDLAELKTFGGAGSSWSSAYDFATPETPSSTTVVGQNTVSMTLQVRVDNPVGEDTEIGSIGGVSGIFTFTDTDLFDERAPLVEADATMAAFGRLTPRDILNMVDATTGWAEALQASELYRDSLPFLDLTTGDAFAFGQAFKEVFLGQLQTAEQVFTAVNAPSTWRSGPGGLERNPVDYSGAGGFMINTGGPSWQPVVVSADVGRTTLQQLAAALQGGIDDALPVGHGISVRVTDTNSPRLEMFAEENTSFVMAGFAPATDGALDLGFNTHTEVLAINDGTLGTFDGSDAITNPAARFQLPELVFDSSASINLTDFTEARTLTVNRNGEGPVTLTLPGLNYSNISTLAERLRDALEGEALYDVATGDGVQVRVFNEGGVEGLRLFGTGEIYSLELGGDLANFGLSAGPQTSEYIDFQINGNTADTIRVFVSGNRTGNLLGAAPNSSVSDLVSDLQFALKNSSYLLDGGGNPDIFRPLMDESAGTGIDFRSSSDASGVFNGGLQFFARNPGTGAAEIADFEIVGFSSGLDHLGFTAGATSQPFATSGLTINPSFTTIQEFAAELASATDPLLDTSRGVPVYDPSARTFSFPILFTHDPATLTGVSVDLAENYGEIRGLHTDSVVDVDGSTRSQFDFQFGLVPDISDAEILEVEIPISVFEWDGQLEQDDAAFTVILDDGVEHEVLVTAESTQAALNTSTADFVSQLNQAIANLPDLVGKVSVRLDVDAETNRETIVFVTDPANTMTRMMQVRARPEVSTAVTTANAAVANLNFAADVTNFTAVTDEFHASAPVTSVNLTSHTMFRFSLFDGNVGDVLLRSEETSDNTTLQDLVDDINFAIEQSYELSTAYEGKIIAGIDSTDPFNQHIFFKLNEAVFPNDGSYVSENWSVNVFPEYLQQLPNGAVTELSIRQQNVDSADKDVPLTVVSGLLQGPDYAMADAAVFDVSINGSEYVRVTVPPVTATSDVSQGDLLAAINTALEGTPIDVGSLAFNVSDFLRATTFGAGNRIALISLDNSDVVNTPDVLNFRLAPDLANPTTNGALTTLGFLSDEQRLGGRGGELFLESIRLTGTAEVTDQTVAAIGSFGFVEFEAADGEMDLLASSTTVLRDGLRERFSFLELTDLVSNGFPGTIAETEVEPATFVTIELRDLSFPIDPDPDLQIAGLEFGPGAKIILSHALTSAGEISSISDFSALPPPDLEYIDTLGLEKIHSIGFEDIYEGLLRTAEFITDQMKIDPDGSGPAKNAFAENLLFVRSGFVDIFDFGQEFQNAILDLDDAPPRTLQDLQVALANALQVDVADISVSLDTTYDTVDPTILTDAQVNVSLPFMATFGVALPLFVDLVQLRNRSKNPALVGETNGYLEGLDALASSQTNPMEVEINILAELGLDLGIQVVRGGETREPRAVLQESTEILTKFNLSGEELDGDIPVGNARFRLSNGLVAINEAGEVAGDDAYGTPGIYNQAALEVDYVAPPMLTVRVSTLDALAATYTHSNGRLEASEDGALVVDGVSLSRGDLILVNHQNLALENGVYEVVRTGNAGTGFRLERVSAANTVGELNDLYVEVTEGDVYGGRDFHQSEVLGTLGIDAIRFARLIDPAVFSIDLAGDQILPYSVLVATTSQLDASYTAPNIGSAVGASLMASSNQSLNSIQSTLANGRIVVGMDGVNILQVNDLVLIKDQVALTDGTDIRYQNGIYRVKDVGLNGPEGRPWELVRVAFADEAGPTDPGEFTELRIAVQLGRDNGGVRFIQDNDNLNAVAAGQNISFTSDLERVYSTWNTTTTSYDRSAIVNPNGQAQALLPMVIVVTGDDGGELVITKDTSRLTPEDAADPEIVNALPDFVPLNIRVLTVGEPGDAGYGTGIGRLFDPTVSAPVVFYDTADTEAFTEMPPLARNLPPTDVLKLARDPFLMGEALDLSLFNLQFAIDQALGEEFALVGRELPTYTVFIETWRSQFTGLLRDNLRNNPLKPINAMLDSLFEVLGPGGAGYLTDRNADILVETVSNSGDATAWDPADTINNYGLNPLNQEFEKVPATAVGLQFSLDLVKVLDDETSEININRVDMLSNDTGLEIDTQTVALTAGFDPVAKTGGVNLRRSFNLHLGFGVDLQEGFYLFNPANTGPGALPPTHPDAPPLMSIDVQAVLDGDINMAGIQRFDQNQRSSRLNELTVQVSDAFDTPGSTDLASGLYATFDFFLNSGSGGIQGDHITLQDMQQLNTLGLDQALPVPPGNFLPGDLVYGILGYDVDGDVDIHLLIEGGKSGSSFGANGGIPDIQTEFFLQNQYGMGSDILDYNDLAARIGAAQLAVAAGTATQEQQDLVSQPENRYALGAGGQVRTLLDAGQISFTNITLDAEGFLKGTIFEALLKFSDGIAPVRPILDFLLAPVPGTEWMAEPFVLGDLLGKEFLLFARSIVSIDDMIRTLGDGISPGSEAKPDWAKPRVRLGAAANVFFKAAGSDKASKSRRDVDKWIETRNSKRLDADIAKSKSRRSNPGQALTTDRSALARMKNSLSEKVTSPNKFSRRFEQYRDKGFAIKQNDNASSGRLTRYVNKAGNSVKRSANDALARTDDRKGNVGPIVGITGGGIRLDYLKAENVQKILLGETANLSFMELPRLQLGISYSKSFPLPAFPPLVLTVGASLSINAHFKFGWDTEGFYWSTLDTQGNQSPAFGVLARFSVGVALNFGLIEAGIEAFFELQVDFNWNDVTVDLENVDSFSSFTPVDTDAFQVPPTFGDPGSPDFGKLRGEQMDYLTSLPGGTDNLFDVTLTGRVGLTLYVDLTIPIPFVGPITKRIVEKTFAIDLFQKTFFGAKPDIQLAVQTGGTLSLNIGPNANLRLFSHTRDRNEVFTLLSHGAGTSSGEQVQVQATLNEVTYLSPIYDNVTLVTGTAGSGTAIIDARLLERALVQLVGGSGNSTLFSGTAAGTVGNRNQLIGGTGASNLIGSPTTSTILVAGQGNATIVGGSASDQITSGPRSDLLIGGGGQDRFIFLNDFGRDRLSVEGHGNIADFSGVTGDLTFNLGRLVQSAAIGLNTMFFAPDASGSNSIDTWIAGPGDDRFNTFFFPPAGDDNIQLAIDGGLGDNFYAVTLGNPLQRFFRDTSPGAATEFERMDPRNIGRINITDQAGTGHMLIKQVYPEGIIYDRFHVNNVREQVTMVGMETVDLDAGNSTVIWGAPGVDWVDLGVDATITAGTIEMRSNVEVDGLTLNLKRNFDVTKVLNLRNDSDLTLTMLNVDPLGSTNLLLGPDGGGIYSSSGSVTQLGGSQLSSTIGDGSGRITIVAPTGGVLNNPNGAGVIEARAGEVVIDVRDTIGFDSSPVLINSMWLAAVTRKAVGTLAQGINVISDQDVNITRIGNVDGLRTTSGRIAVSVAAGRKITYGNISAGDGRDIILSADAIELSPGRNEEVSTYEFFIVDVTYTFTYYIPVTYSVPVYIPLVGTIYYNYTVVEPRTYSVVVPELRFGEVVRNNPVPAGGSIDTAGTVYLRNVTDGLDIRVADTAAQPGMLNITRELLDDITTSAAAIIVGRDKDEAIHTGVVDVRNYAFQSSTEFHARGAEIVVPGTGVDTKLTSASSLVFETYEGAGTGNMLFQNGSGFSALEAPTILATAFRSIEVDTAFTSTADDGLIRLIAGLGASTIGAANNTGDLTITANGVVQAVNPGASVVLKSGATSGDMRISSDVNAAIGIDLEALGGSITVDAPARLVTDLLMSASLDSSTLRTDVRRIISGRVIGDAPSGGQNLIIDELNDLDIVFLEAGADAGFIRVTAGGFINLDKIDATSGNDVALTALGGAITREVPVVGDFNVRADLLTATAAGAITLDTEVNNLVASATVAGDIVINNVAGLNAPLLVSQARTFDGLIQIDTDGDLTVRSAQSLNSTADNSITLRTRELFGGHIVVDDINAGAAGDVYLEAGSFTPDGAGLPTSGGTILSDSATTNRVVARELIALSRGYPAYPETLGIDLRTEVDQIIARTFAGGDARFIDARVDIRIDELDSVLLRRAQTVFGDIRVTAGGDITHQAVRAPNRDIYLTSTGGAILLGDDPVVIDSETIASKIFGRHLKALADDGIRVNTSVDSLEADSLGAGDVVVTETDGVRLQQVTTNSGNIDITVGEYDAGAIVTPGNAEIGLIRAGLTAGDDVTMKVYGQALASGQPGTPLINNAFLPFANAKIHGELLDVLSYGRMDLLTNVDRLIAENFSIGNIIIQEDNAVDILRLVADRGRIEYTAGGTITARLIEVLTDITQSSTFDISLHATAGDILVDRVDAGTLFNDLYITVDAGNLEEVAPEDALDTFISPLMDGIDLVADNAVLDVFGSIGELAPIETQFNHLTADARTTGDIDLNEHDSVELNRVDANNGSIIIDAGGEITARTVRSLTDAEANSVTLHNTAGDILIDFVSAGKTAGDLYITSDAGRIEEVDPQDNPDSYTAPDVSGVDLVSDYAELRAMLGIGEARPLETEMNELVAEVFGSGSLHLREQDALILRDVSTINGDIIIEANSDLLLDWVDGRNRRVELTSGGSIEEEGRDASVDLKSREAILIANGGIGALDPIETRVDSLRGEANGDVQLDETGSSVFESLISNNGLIRVNVRGNLSAVDVRTGSDGDYNDIELTVGGTLSAGEIIAGSNSFRSGNPANAADVLITAGTMVELGNDGTVDIRGEQLTFVAGSIGRGNPIETSGSEIDSIAGGGANALTNFSGSDVLVTNLSIGGGNIFFEQVGGGNLDVKSIVIGSGNLELIIRDGGKLNLQSTRIGGDALFQADDMTFYGGPGSVQGTGSLTIQPNNPEILTYVNIYGDLPDLPGILGIDLTDLRAIDFAEVFFGGSVELFLPEFALGDLNLLFTSPGDADGAASALAGVDTLEFLRNGALLENADEALLLSYLTYFQDTLGYSPWGALGLESSMVDLVHNGIWHSDDWVRIFTVFFGFNPYALSGLDGGLFEQLLETLANNNSGDGGPSSGSLNVPVETRQSAERELLQAAMVAETGELSEYVEHGESGFFSNVAEVMGRGRFALAMIPVLLMGRVKRQTTESVSI